MSRQSWTLINAAAVAMCVLVAYPTPADAQEIDVTPMAINVTVPYGETATRTLTIQNQGSADLLWSDNKGEVLRQFPFFGDHTYGYNGLAFDGTHLRVTRAVAVEPGFKLYLGKIDPANGAWLGEIEVLGAFTSRVGFGLDWDGTYLWTADFAQKRIIALDPVSGQVVRNLPMPFDGSIQISPVTVALGGGYLWVTGYKGTQPYRINVLHKLNPVTGALISTLPQPAGISIEPLEYFRGALWMGGITDIYKVDPANGQVLDSFPAPELGDTFHGTAIRDMAKGGPGDEGRLWMMSQNLQTSAHKFYLVEMCEIPWLRKDLRSGTVPGGSSRTVTLTLDSVAAGVGVHTTTVTILANDGDEPRTQVPVTFTVTRVGGPPVISKAAWADPNPVPMLATAVHVVASDPDGDPLTYAWTRVSGPAGKIVTFATAAADSGVTFDFREGGSYVLRVTVSDDKGNSVSSDVQVRVALDIRADVNQDGVVNALDSQILIENLGKTVPQ